MCVFYSDEIRLHSYLTATVNKLILLRCLMNCMSVTLESVTVK